MKWLMQRQAQQPEQDIRYSNPDHKVFNTMQAKQRSPPVRGRDLNVPWMAINVREKLPELVEDFKRSLDAVAEENAQRRQRLVSAQSGEGAKGQVEEQPKPELKPKGPLRGKADQAAREELWMAKVRNEVMSQENLQDQLELTQKPILRMESTIK